MKKDESNEEKQNNMILKKEVEKNSTDNKYYIPSCRNKECDGHLKISIDEEKFIINGICQKNKEHIFNNLYFETFERFYLKENIIQKCFKCYKNLETKNKYECKKCEKIYCSECFIFDEHIKENLKNLKLLTNRCPNDENILTFYCLDCKEKICSICFKINKEKNRHRNHKVINIIDIIPSKSQLDILKEKIIEKSNTFDSLINSLDEWQKELNKKIERIKQNLKNEIRIIKKLFFNFNIDYIDYIHYSIFNEFFDGIKNFKNVYLEQFMKAYDFIEKTKNIFNFLTSKNKKQEIINKEGELKKCLSSKNCFILKKFNEQYCLFNNYNSHILSLISENNGKACYLNKSKTEFEEEIFRFNISIDRKNIYACLKNKKSINIFNYNSDDNTIKLTEEKIEIGENGHFNKCIHINNNCLLIIDDMTLYLFSKNKLNSQKFINTNKITFETKIYDICKIDDKYALISQKSKLIIINNEILKIEKEINKIDCLEKSDNLIIIKDCILVNCKKGIAMISIKTKEMIQYIFDDENLGDKSIVKSFDDYIYILNSSGNLLKYSFYDYNLILTEITEIEKPDDDSSSKDISFNNLYPFVLKDKIYFFNSYNIFILDK